MIETNDIEEIDFRKKNLKKKKKINSKKKFSLKSMTGFQDLPLERAHGRCL